MSEQSRTRRYLRILSIAVGLVLPALSLMPLGSLWLWERGVILYWALASTLIVLFTFLALQRLFRERIPQIALENSPTASNPAGTGEPWTPSEARAWEDVVAIAGQVDPARITSQEAALELAFETIDAVARKIHPEVREPVWQFTVPEALAMLERVSKRLGTFVDEHVPLSDRITVAQALVLYRWRGTIDALEKAYGIWRIARLANPMSAATMEIRERLSKQMLQWGREQIARQLAEAYVMEVGRAAIDLYGGRLSIGERELGAHVTGVARTDRDNAANETAEPLRVMVAGQVSAGKSSLVNALAGEVRAAVDVLPTTSRFVPYELKRSGLPTALIIDSPGLDPNTATVDELVQRSADCDIILWVAAANAADRQLDRRAISGFRSNFAAKPNRRRPPMLLVLTNIDRLRPFKEWLPPYDLEAANKPKAQSINEALEAAAADLQFDVAEVVPVSLLNDREPYNIDALWSRIVAILPEAQRAQLLRRLQDLKSESRWSRLWSQTVSGGQLIGRTMKR
jgi:uncharacterized protein